MNFSTSPWIWSTSSSVIFPHQPRTSPFTCNHFPLRMSLFIAHLTLRVLRLDNVEHLRYQFLQLAAAAVNEGRRYVHPNDGTFGDACKVVRKQAGKSFRRRQGEAMHIRQRTGAATR